MGDYYLSTVQTERGSDIRARSLFDDSLVQFCGTDGTRLTYTFRSWLVA